MADNNTTTEEIKLFDGFIRTFIIDKTSLLDKGIRFEANNITSCLNMLKDLKTMNKPEDGEDKSLETALANEDGTSSKYELLWHCYYIMYLMGETAKTFFKKTVDNGDLFVEKGNGAASTNQAYNSEAIRPFRMLLYIIKYLWSENCPDPKTVKERIIEILPKTKEKNKYSDCQTKLDCDEIDDRIKNILLYLCDPDQYMPIVSQNHKNGIWNNLCFLKSKTNEEYNELEFKSLLDEIKKLRVAESNKNKGDDNLNGFYHKSVRPFWDTPKMSTKTNKDGDLPLNTLLTFKKAIVLYGPPGTSKTYTARELAKNVISVAFAEKLKEAKTDKKKETKEKITLFKSFISNEDKIFGEQGKSGETTENKSQEDQEILNHIHRLQLHPNYTYDDFIAGKTITVNAGQTEIVTQKGYLLKLIDKINEDKKDEESKFKDLPHIVILDEINRVDISRVFGELFTAMESDYRKDGVDLPLTGEGDNCLKLKVPTNLYFIGTMNMIDFSLEQVDFALRRRFAWVESNYDDDRLKDIINYKIKKESIKDKDLDSKTIKNYVDGCTSVNELITKQPNLGPTYKIGHTFFAEIIDIYKEMIGKWKSANEFLWNISIKPMIEAYCGTMDLKAREDFVKECKEKFVS